MSETGSEIPQPKSKLSKAFGAVKGALSTFNVESKPVPLDEITPRKVAEVINTMRNPLRQNDQLFDLKTVLQNMNYYGDDLKHPEVRDKVRKIINENLQHRNIVEASQVEGKDGIKTYYRIANEQALQDLVKDSGGK